MPGKARIDAKVTTRPLHGNVFRPEGQELLFYQPDAGFQGFDRFTVSGEVNNVPVEKTVHITVGQSFYSETNVVYEKVADQLFALAIVAIFLEMALSAIFRNRAFQKANLFPGIKTIISFAVALLIVFSFDFNIFREVRQALRKTATMEGALPTCVSAVITALLLAGGTSTVFFLYTKLKIRNPFASGVGGPGLVGSGTLKIKVVRGANIKDTEPVSILLDDNLLAVRQGGQSIFGDDKDYQLEAGSYTIKAKANDKTGNPSEISRLIAIEPDKPTEMELTFS